MEGEPSLFGRSFAGHHVRGRSTSGSKNVWEDNRHQEFWALLAWKEESQ